MLVSSSYLAKEHCVVQQYLFLSVLCCAVVENVEKPGTRRIQTTDRIDLQYRYVVVYRTRYCIFPFPISKLFPA